MARDVPSVKVVNQKTRYPIYDWDSSVTREGLMLECPRTKRKCSACGRLFVRGEFPPGIKEDEDVRFGFDVCVECGVTREMQKNES